jgi:hypothetical protein
MDNQDGEKEELPRKITPDFHDGQIVVHRSLGARNLFFSKDLLPREDR